MNFLYSICGSLYFSRSRGRWTCFWETVIQLARATLNAQPFLGEPHMLQAFPLVTRWHSTDRPQKKHQCLCDWKTSVLSYSTRKNHHQQRAQEKNIDISGPWPTRVSWEKSVSLSGERANSLWAIMGHREHVWVGWTCLFYNPILLTSAMTHLVPQLTSWKYEGGPCEHKQIWWTIYLFAYLFSGNSSLHLFIFPETNVLKDFHPSLSLSRP